MNRPRPPSRPRRRMWSKDSSPVATPPKRPPSSDGPTCWTPPAGSPAGEGNLKALNPNWDNTFLDQLAAGDLDAIDRYTNDSIKELGGRSGQEIRNWIAAYAALSAVGEYDMHYRYYRPIPEFIAGFAVTTASPRASGQG